MKLSRTGWNNVIIFSVMSMILLINQMDKHLFQSGSDVSSKGEILLVEQHGTILTLAVNQQIFIERIGRTWRAKPAKISGQSLEQMMLAWQDNSGIIIEEPEGLKQQSGVVVTLELAGQQESIVMSLYPVKDQLLLYHHARDIWLSLPLPIYQQLLPAILFQ